MYKGYVQKNTSSADRFYCKTKLNFMEIRLLVLGIDNSRWTNKLSSITFKEILHWTIYLIVCVCQGFELEISRN
jgi:hypothetical protein